MKIKIGNRLFIFDSRGRLSKSSAKSVNPTTYVSEQQPSVEFKTTKIYQPYDPFQTYIDEVDATASITDTHKPWVKLSWFILNIVLPIFYALALTLA